MADFWVKQYDTAPTLEARLLDGDGNAVDLSGATVTFVRRAIDGVTVNYDPAINRDDGTEPLRGRVAFDWAPDDLDVPGGYYVEWQVDFAGGQGRETFPNDGYQTLAVIPDLGNAEGS